MTAADMINSFTACRGLIPTKDEYEYYCDKYKDSEYSIRRALCKFDCSVLNQEERNKVYLRFMTRSSSMDIQHDAMGIHMKIDDLRRAERRFRECQNESDKRRYFNQLISIASIIVVKRIILLYYNIPVIIDPDKRSSLFLLGEKVSIDEIVKKTNEKEPEPVQFESAGNINHLRTLRVKGTEFYVDIYYIIAGSDEVDDKVEGWIYKSSCSTKRHIASVSIKVAGSIKKAIEYIQGITPNAINEYNNYNID